MESAINSLKRQSFDVPLRESKFKKNKKKYVSKKSKYRKLKCPKVISTRWLYIIDCLKFIFGYSDALYAGRDDGYNIPKIPKSFIYIYEIIINYQFNCRTT